MQHSPTVLSQSPIVIVAPVRPNVPIQETRPELVEENPRPTEKIIVVQPAPVMVVGAQNCAEPKTIPSNSAKEYGNNSETIRKQFQTIPKAAQNLPKPTAQIPAFKKRADVGRRRKYEEPGVFGDIPVKKVIVFRHIKNRHWPGMSADMREWYEWFYFTEPKIGEQPFRGKSYEQHQRSYKRGRIWIAEYEASQQQPTASGAVGHSGATVIPFSKRATS